MPRALDTPGAVFRNGTIVLLARIVGADNAPIIAADVASLSYTVAEVDPCLPDSLTPVEGHDAEALAAAEVISDALVVSELWTVDEVGHNFLHEVDVSTDEAFPKAGVDYQVRYELVPVDGQKIVFRYRLRSL